MKKIIALLLVLCIIVPALVACDNTTPVVDETQGSQNTPDTSEPIVTPTEKYTIAVSADGADGAYTTVQAAIDAIADIDKAKYIGIDVIVKSGTYIITEPIAIAAANAGTASCPVTIIGEKGASIVGGVALTSADFVKATGDSLQYMPAEVQDKIVQIDLTKYGYTVDQIRAMIASRNYITEVPVLTVAGERQTLCRYPNEDWAQICAESTMLDQYGNPTMLTDNEGGEFQAETIRLEYGDEHFDTVTSWHDYSLAHIMGHFAVLWVPDRMIVSTVSETDATLTVPYFGGYAPVEGGIYFFYNVPEELDIPGEYYIDENAILYYYPGEDFEDAQISLPLSNGFMTLDNADYLTLDNLVFESSLSSGIVGTADNLTIQNCDISAVVGEDAINLTGYNILIQGNHIHNLSQAGVFVNSGDLETLTDGNSKVINNYIHDWGIVHYPYADGIAVEGVTNLVAHNIMHSSNASAISGEGAYNVVEYNHIYDVLRTSDDIGATGNSGLVCNITRYNYIHHIGAVGVAGEVENLNKMGSAAIYWDGGSSYAEAYGNVIETVKGHGVIMNGGRSLKVHGNLIIDCTMWYVQCVAMFYARALDEGYTGARDRYPDYVNNAVWVEANPELSKIVEDLSQTTPDDPMGWCTTYGDELHSNWIHYNKYGRAFSNWGIRPYYVEDHVYTFCPDTVTIDKSGTDPEHTTDYNSRRGAPDIEQLIKETAAGVLDLTWEQFNQIGIVESEWHLDIELPALIQTAE